MPLWAGATIMMGMPFTAGDFSIGLCNMYRHYLNVVGSSRVPLGIIGTLADNDRAWMNRLTGYDALY